MRGGGTVIEGGPLQDEGVRKATRKGRGRYGGSPRTAQTLPHSLPLQVETEIFNASRFTASSHCLQPTSRRSPGFFGILEFSKSKVVTQPPLTGSQRGSGTASHLLLLSHFPQPTNLAQVTKEFLEFSKSKGNDLMTPAPWYNFPGLKPGDKWCLCALRWKEAFDAGVAPPVGCGCLGKGRCWTKARGKEGV